METFHNTTGYMIAGYAIAFLVMGMYVLSMYLRHRDLSQNLEALEAISNESKPKPARVETSKSKPSAKKSKASIKKKK